jgi:hypothetical protein
VRLQDSNRGLPREPGTREYRNLHIDPGQSREPAKRENPRDRSPQTGETHPAAVFNNNITNSVVTPAGYVIDLRNQAGRILRDDDPKTIGAPREGNTGNTSADLNRERAEAARWAHSRER